MSKNVKKFNDTIMKKVEVLSLLKGKKFNKYVPCIILTCLQKIINSLTITFSENGARMLDVGIFSIILGFPRIYCP